jgi:hypothetical protein
MEARVIRSALLRAAEWLVGEDEAGRAAIGDLEELSAEWGREKGEPLAALRLAVELGRSFPAFARIALEDSGVGLVLRSVPALLGGGVFFCVLVGVFGATTSGSLAGKIAAVATVLVFGIAAGWITGVLAGKAPRQHGLALGIGLAVAGWILVAAAGEELAPLRSWVMVFGLCVIPAAAYGGCLRARSLRTGAAGPPDEA